MRTVYALVYYSGLKTRQTISVHDTAIQADDAWRKKGQNADERIILQTLRDDGSVAYEQTLMLAGYKDAVDSKNVFLIPD